jgi:hypothetical protein
MVRMSRKFFGTSVVTHPPVKNGLPSRKILTFIINFHRQMNTGMDLPLIRWLIFGKPTRITYTMFSPISPVEYFSSSVRIHGLLTTYGE